MIGAIGAASDIWQALQTSQSSQASTSPSNSFAAATQPSATASGGNPVGQLASDVQSLLLSLQSGAGSGTASTSSSAPSTSATTSATTPATSSGTDPLAAVENDLQKLSQASPPGGHHHHHHGGGGGIQTDATTGQPSLASGAQPNQGLADAIAQAITAYQAPGQAAGASTALAA